MQTLSDRARACQHMGSLGQIGEGFVHIFAPRELHYERLHAAWLKPGSARRRHERIAIARIPRQEHVRMNLRP